MKFGVVVFPGSNCDRDTVYAVESAGGEAYYLWHKETNLRGADCIILPGGFAYGDYLRTGAIARFSPIMKSVIDFADKGGLVFGICNGFQVLLESGLLPGAMMINKTLKFLGQDIFIRVEETDTPYTHDYYQGSVLRIPVAHFEGNYYADEDTLSLLEQEERIIFRYCERDGTVSEEGNLNGSLRSIAGICSENRKVLGMMPHPERASAPILGKSDGFTMWKSLLKYFGEVA
jgi:phosphoribosylformylglycinamidine synthase